MFLKRIDDCVEEIRFELKSRLSAFVEKEYKLVIYGVGMVGRRVFECLSCGEERIPVEGFMVEWPDRNPSYWMGKKVKGIGEYDPDRCIVLVALATHNRPGVVEKLSSMGYQNVVMLDKNSNLL